MKTCRIVQPTRGDFYKKKIVERDLLYLQKELESTAAPAEEAVALTVVTKKTTKSQTGTETQIKSGNPETAPTIKLPFKNVTVIGDSHSRHLASLMCKSSRRSNIGGFCKPSAGLLSVAPPPPIRQTTDVHYWSGQMTWLLGSRTSSSTDWRKLWKTVVRPPRSWCCRCLRGTTCHLTAQFTRPRLSLIIYIAELCFLTRARKWWISATWIEATSPHTVSTSSSKQLLADLILQRIAGMMPRPRRRVTAITALIRSTPLQRLDHAVTPAPAPPAAPCGPSPPAQPRSPAAHTSPAPPEPPVRTMAYDTFAETVKNQRPAKLHYNHTVPLTKRLRDILNSFGLICSVNTPTRVTATSSKAIDNVITNITNASVTVFNVAISDHFAQETTISNFQPEIEHPSSKIKRH
ncbi:hypothetical protein J6590_058714 [Homalodisca vitripennis]|nr:hypothetical protein J6590_058714 [Homalodisca vitripennis]